MTLTQQDLDNIEQILDQKLDEKFNLLPSKEEFFSRMDEVVGELKKVREEQTVIAGAQSEQADRIAKLESTQAS